MPRQREQSGFGVGVTGSRGCTEGSSRTAPAHSLVRAAGAPRCGAAASAPPSSLASAASPDPPHVPKAQRHTGPLPLSRGAAGCRAAACSALRRPPHSRAQATRAPVALAPASR
eukprot:4049539-Prymnesium_polylepis.1